MRKTILILLLASIYAAAYGQIIKGTIKNNVTGDLISYATIYINGTFVGTYSDSTGNFVLDISRYASLPLTVSALGYYSFNIPNLDPNKDLLIYLSPKLTELNEVIINAKKITRERRTNMNIFKREFLGTTINSANCKIVNEEDIVFSYDSSGDTLNASSLKPIIIENEALGYMLNYYLDKFQTNTKSRFLRIVGNCTFREDLTISGELKEKYERRRYTTYLGSRMHFFRSLWANSLSDDGFAVKDLNNKELLPDKYLCQTRNPDTGLINKYICNQKTMKITYYTTDTASKIYLNKDFVYFDRDGGFDPVGITWQGDMSKQRIADLLPLEY